MLFTRTIFRKLMFTFLPLVLMVVLLVSLFSYQFAKKQVTDDAMEIMKNQGISTVESIDLRLNKHEDIGISLANAAGVFQSQLPKQSYVDLLKRSLNDTDDTLGVGIWFEPYSFNKTLRFFGPYVYKDQGEMVYTEEYEKPAYNYPSQDWYKAAVKSNGKPTWTSPYYDETTKITMVTAAIPFYDNKGIFKGITTADIDISSIQETMKKIKIAKTGWASLIDQDGNFVSHKDLNKVMKAKLQSDDQLKGLANKLSGDHGFFTEKINGETNFIYFDTLKRTGWKIVLMAPEAELLSPVNNLMVKMVIIAIAIIGLAAIVVYFFAKRMSRSVKVVNEKISLISAGDLTVTVQETAKDEIGQLAHYFNEMVISVKQLIVSVKSAVVDLHVASEHLSAISEETSASSEEIANAISGVASGASDVALRIDQALNKMQNLSESIEDVYSYLDTMKGLSEKQDEQNVQGMKKMSELREKSQSFIEVMKVIEGTIFSLAEKSKEIETVIDSISDISNQTNLLALNASIEAARAGEHGKGFAVVASEVRKLAEQSKLATEKVSDTIRGIGQQSIEAANQMTETKTIADDTILMVDESEKVFHQISEHAAELSSSIQTMAKKVSSMNELKEEVVDTFTTIQMTTEQAAAASEQISATTDEQLKVMRTIAKSAEDLTRASDELTNKASQFKTE